MHSGGNETDNTMTTQISKIDVEAQALVNKLSDALHNENINYQELEDTSADISYGELEDATADIFFQEYEDSSADIGYGELEDTTADIGYQE